MDETETVELDFTTEEFLNIAIMAHQKDVTINEMINILLREAMDSEALKEL